MKSIAATLTRVVSFKWYQYYLQTSTNLFVTTSFINESYQSSNEIKGKKEWEGFKMDARTGKVYIEVQNLLLLTKVKKRKTAGYRIQEGIQINSS